MRKYILFFCCINVCVVQAFAQHADSRRITQLKTLLPFLTGRFKADCLTDIAFNYVKSNVVQSDSGALYARQAFDFGEKNDYRQAMLIAADLYADVLLQQSKANEGLAW